jgi:hypothetical protein
MPPWQARGIEIRGRADVLSTGGKAIMVDFDDAIFRIRPSKVVTWGF